MSSYEIPFDRHQERLELKAKRLVNGSAITIIFAPDWSEVVVGWSKKPLKERGHVWKFPCGKAEVEDVPDIERADNTAVQFANCASRECMNESGLDERHFEFLQPLTYVRKSSSRESGALEQWHFLALLKKRLVLPTEPIESDEMGDPEYWKVVDVLRLPTIRNPISQERKVNPYHQIALARCILELRDVGRLHHDSNFSGFKDLLTSIYDDGVDIDTYEQDVLTKIRAREL